MSPFLPVNYALTIVTAENSSDALWHIQEETGQLLALFGARDIEFTPLEPGRVLDVRFTDGAYGYIRERLALYRESRRYDYILQPADNRRKMLLLCDMDSTVIGQECIDELAAELGLREQVSAITERAMQGEIPFEEALRARVALLKGLPVGVIDKLLAERITLNPGARELVQAMRGWGAHTVLVSGGFTLFTAAIAGRCGFDEHHANRLEIENGHLTGTVEEPIQGQEAKLQQLHAQLLARQLPPEASLAVGDGANDIPMLSGAGLGVGYRAKPLLLEVADADIRYTDLSTLIWAQNPAISTQD